VERMTRFESRKDELAKTGTELAYIAAEKRNGVFKPARFLEKKPISFSFLLDEERTVTKAYGLYHRIGVDALNIAHPATFVIDRERYIRYIYRGQSQQDRAPLEQVIRAVEQVGGRR
jgi:peroxiredoxin